MSVRLKPVREQVMVVTGATSGIGLATAKAAAEAGARVVLVARNAEALARAVREIEADGGTATSVAADVSDRGAVERVAEATIARYGVFDTWVNNAGTSIFGRLEEVSDEDHRRLFDINFWSVVYGSLIAVEHLKRRGGAIINLGSVASDIALPLQGMYSATKHAIKGFTEALRMELEAEGAPISITLIKPTSINTPFPQNAKNYMDREPKLPPPVYPPEEVADTILHAASHPARDLYVGGAGRLMSAFGRQAPRAMDWLSERTMMPEEQRNEPPREPEGTLYQPGRGGRVHGEQPGYVMKSSLYSRAARHPVLTTFLLAAAGATATMLLQGGRRRATNSSATGRGG